VTAGVALAVVYFFSMYGFSMLTGHLVALVPTFLIVARSADCPPLLAVALFSYFSNLCGCLTNYTSGPIVIYFGLGYVTAARWCAIGLAVALLHLTVWLGVGLPYWRALGWW
jgi:DASS family divalent anion:Na+ symporter